MIVATRMSVGRRRGLRYVKWQAIQLVVEVFTIYIFSNLEMITTIMHAQVRCMVIILRMILVSIIHLVRWASNCIWSRNLTRRTSINIYSILCLRSYFCTLDYCVCPDAWAPLLTLLKVMSSTIFDSTLQYKHYFILTRW